MSDTREKLIETLMRFGCDEKCDSCEFHEKDIFACLRKDAGIKADHLIANGVTVQEWVPVSEPPKKEFEEFTKGTDWDVYPCLASVGKTDGGRYVTKLFYDGKRFVNSECVCYTAEVTHWMPLHDPPKGE